MTARPAFLDLLRQPGHLLPATGHCHWCDASVPGESHFCDSDCRDMYDNAKRMERINGKR